MNIRMAAVAACVLALGGSPARADIIQAVFTGVITSAGPGYFGPPDFDTPNSWLVGLSIIETFTFDTAKGTPQPAAPGFNTIFGGLISASLTIPGVWQVGAAGGPFTLSFLEWSDDFSLGDAWVNDNGGYTNFEGANGFFQTGPCPGAPCGHSQVTTWSITDLGPSPIIPSPVPGPLVGSGLPGLLALLALMLGRRRYVKVMV